MADKPIIENLPVHLNLGDSRNPQDVIGWATSFDMADGTYCIQIKLNHDATEKLRDLSSIFELKALGFAGIARRRIDASY